MRAIGDTTPVAGSRLQSDGSSIHTSSVAAPMRMTELSEVRSGGFEPPRNVPMQPSDVQLAVPAGDLVGVGVSSPHQTGDFDS